MKFLIGICLSVLSWSAFGQAFPFDVHVRPSYSHPALGVQAFAYAQVNNELLIIGGRKDGLHRRQPFASMDSAGMNQFITLYNLLDHSVKQASIASLPTQVAEQFTSTNMEFCQYGDYLYLVGGYGYSPSIQDHVTHPIITSIFLPDFIQSLKEGKALDGIQFMSSAEFAITGGALLHLNDRYYLVGGNRFDGRYNPMGGPSYTQTYTEKISQYRFTHEYGVIQVTEVQSHSSKALLHRRDLNVLPSVNAQGLESGVAFSGVFQPDIDLPWQNSIAFKESGYREIPQFVHHLNQYHCAHFSAYSKSSNTNYYLFLGGMGEFYLDGKTMTQSNDVPFVKNIGLVTQHGDSSFVEYLLPSKLPYYLGSSAEFVPNTSLPYLAEHVLDFDRLQHDVQDSLLVGYLLGGIQSNAPNIFWINDGTQSFPNQTLYEVWLTPTKQAAMPVGDVFRVYPNNTFNRMKIDFSCSEPSKVKIRVYDYHGRRIMNKRLGSFPAGNHTVTRRGNFLNKEHFYTIQLERNGVITEQRLVVTE